MDAENSTSSGTSADHYRRRVGNLRDWLMVAWVLWWSWAYAQSALGHRFPQLLALLRWHG
jgi:hypothetical protein